MAFGQLRLMQDVAESSSWTGADAVAPGAGRTRLGRFSGPASRSNDRRVRVQHAVEAEILPRVSVGHILRPNAESVDAVAAGELVHILLRPDHETSVAHYVEAALTRDFAVEHIYLRLFQPVARRLGELWNDDICSFVDVTLAMGTLQGWLRRLSPKLHRHDRGAHAARSILLTTLPGDQHTFGVNMTAEFFRRSGWDVCTDRWEDARELDRAVRARNCTVIGFSASGERRLDELAAAIASVRRARKAGLAVLVGGPVFMAHPEQAIRVGADAVGLDARHAVAQAESLAGRTGRG